MFPSLLLRRVKSSRFFQQTCSCWKFCFLDHFCWNYFLKGTIYYKCLDASDRYTWWQNHILCEDFLIYLSIAWKILIIFQQTLENITCQILFVENIYKSVTTNRLRTRTKCLLKADKTRLMTHKSITFVLAQQHKYLMSISLIVLLSSDQTSMESHAHS